MKINVQNIDRGVLQSKPSNGKIYRIQIGLYFENVACSMSVD